MTKFITTIQLQGADERDYTALLKELEKESFKDEKHAAKSEAWVGGKGVFSREGNVTLLEVNNAVFRAASKIGKKYSFFVVKNKQTAYAEN